MTVAFVSVNTAGIWFVRNVSGNREWK